MDGMNTQPAAPGQAESAGQARLAHTPPGPAGTMPRWARVLLQSLLVALFVLGAFLLVYGFQAKIALASLAASAFIAFGFPAAQSARVRFLLGGYVCGVVCGILCSLGRHALPEPWLTEPMVSIIFCALAVFFTSLLMFGFGLQHPPANALAVSLVLEPAPIFIGVAMLGCILLLCAVRWLVVRFLGRFFPSSA